MDYAKLFQSLWSLTDEERTELFGSELFSLPPDEIQSRLEEHLRMNHDRRIRPGDIVRINSEMAKYMVFAVEENGAESNSCWLIRPDVSSTIKICEEELTYTGEHIVLMDQLLTFLQSVIF